MSQINFKIAECTDKPGLGVFPLGSRKIRKGEKIIEEEPLISLSFSEAYWQNPRLLANPEYVNLLNQIQVFALMHENNPDPEQKYVCVGPGSAKPG